VIEHFSSGIALFPDSQFISAQQMMHEGLQQKATLKALGAIEQS
jgi:hypothetical protein